MTEPRKLAKARAAASALPSEPLVSIIIPTFNRRDILLSRALPSILRQTYTNWECIIACHGCTDHTADILDVRYGEDDRFRVFEVPRTETYPPKRINHWYAGPVAPLNYGLSQVRGDLIARIDDDDVWLPHHLWNAVTHLSTGGVEFYSCRHKEMKNDNEKVVDPYEFPKGILIGGTQTWVYRSYLKLFRYNPDCWRKPWNRVNDTDLQARMVDAGVRTVFSWAVGCTIKPRPGESHVGSKAYLGSDAIDRSYAFD